MKLASRRSGRGALRHMISWVLVYYLSKSTLRWITTQQLNKIAENNLRKGFSKVNSLWHWFYKYLAQSRRFDVSDDQVNSASIFYSNWNQQVNIWQIFSIISEAQSVTCDSKLTSSSFFQLYNNIGCIPLLIQSIRGII